MKVHFLSETKVKEEKSKKENILDKVVVIVLAGGQGERLFPLTKTRCKPAITFGGRYSLIDIPISHSLSTGLKRIYVVGQFLASSLQKHLSHAYGSLHGDRAISLLVPEERNGQRVWFKGTADAIRQNLKYFTELDANYFLILSGDQLYNIDFLEMIEKHVSSGAGLTIAAKPVTEKEAKRMGLLRIDHETSRVIDFHEKPKDKETLDRYYLDRESLFKMGYNLSEGRNYLGSMGIYLFNRDSLFSLLDTDQREDFGKHLITTQMKQNNVRAFLYDGYWEDIGTVEAYYEANLALTEHYISTKHGLQCYDEERLILTRSHHLPGVKVVDTKIGMSILCEGVICEATEIFHSLIGIRSIIGKGSVIKDSILLGNEYYRKPLTTGEEPYYPYIGQEVVLKKVIVDENVQIGDRVQLVNKNRYSHYDPSPGEPSIYVREGIIVVARGTKIPDDFVF